MDKEKINKGMKISKKFPAGLFDEVYHLRKAIWANAVLNDLNRSYNEKDYVRKFDDDDVITADVIMDDSIKMNDKIEKFKDTL